MARDAFVAGNDVLYLGNIISSDAPDNYSTVVGIVGSFVKKYREDPAFAQRVDASVLRILSMKNRLYGRFAIGNVAPPLSGLNRIGNSEQQGVGRSQPFLAVALPEWADEDTIAAALFVPQVGIDGLLEARGLDSPLRIDRGPEFQRHFLGGQVGVVV